MPTRASEVEPSRSNKPHAREQPPGRSAPETVTGSNHINVAFPFSKINVQDPSSELRDLAALLADLIAALEATTGGRTNGGQLKELRERSQELAARLG
jgi:hypothetical protein